jgi:hypothetical protein
MINWAFRYRLALGLLGVALWQTKQSCAQPASMDAPQAGAPSSKVSSSAFYVGLGASYNFMNFGTQTVVATGTSDVTQNGSLTAVGTATGPAADVHMNSQSTAAPSIQGGYFQHFPDTDWLWGGKFSYSYLGTTSTTKFALIPQFGSFTTTSDNSTVPFTGTAVVRSYQTAINHQMVFAPYIGRAFDSSFVYIGLGPTLSRTQTNLDGLVGFADINGKRSDISGAPQNFTSSGWVFGGAVMVGATYFFNSYWFLDLSYMAATTFNKTSNYSSTFSNPSGVSGSTTAGTLVGSSAGRVITQAVMLTINRAF